MSFQVYSQISTPDDHVYKLVQLPPDLVSYLKLSPEKCLQFKSPVTSHNHLVLCTEDSTYTVRQMNHSNTALLVNDMAINKLGQKLENGNDTVTSESSGNLSGNLLAIGLSNYQYELTKTSGYIDTQGVPVYEGAKIQDLESLKTVDEVKVDSPIANSQFYSAWYNLLGCEVEGKAVILAPNFVTEALHTLISIVIAGKLTSFTTSDISAKAQMQNKLYTSSVVHTLTQKFCLHREKLELDKSAIAWWFGIHTLKMNTNALPDKEMLLKWKLSLPPFFDVSLDMSALHGYYCRPVVGTVRYLPRDSLATEITTRIKELFSVVKEWDFDEFLPFIAEFVPANKKPDAVIVKYARKKRVGKKFVVCPR